SVPHRFIVAWFSCVDPSCTGSNSVNFPSFLLSLANAATDSASAASASIAVNFTDLILFSLSVTSGKGETHRSHSLQIDVAIVGSSLSPLDAGSSGPVAKTAPQNMQLRIRLCLRALVARR